MALSTETQAWLDGLSKDGGISADQLLTIKSALESNSKADEYVKGSGLRQADYSRRQADLQTARTELERATADLKTKEAGVTQYQTELGQWKAVSENKIVAALQAREAAEKSAAAALSRLQLVGGKYGVDPADLNLEGVVIPKKDETVPTFDTSKFITREDAGKGLQEAALMDAMIHDLSVAHQELFGKPLTGAYQLVDEALKANIPLSKYWESKYKVEDKRKEVQAADIQRQITEGVEREKTKMLSELNLPGGRGMVGVRDDLRGSPILKEGGLPAPPADGGQGVSAAIAAFQSGKYKGGVSH